MAFAVIKGLLALVVSVKFSDLLALVRQIGELYERGETFVIRVQAGKRFDEAASSAKESKNTQKLEDLFNRPNG